MANTIKIDCKNTKMIAHRGLSGIERENSLSAFTAAGNRSYFGIETDVHKTADGKFVIIHDDNTGRVSKTAISVEGSNFDDLRELLLTDRDESEGRIDLRIPTLEEYIKVCAKYEKKSILEFKNGFEKTDIEKIVAVIRELGHLENTIFISFVLQNLIYLRELLPVQPAQYLSGDFTPEVFNALKKYSLGLDVQYAALSEKVITDLHSAGIEINCWTCDDPVSTQRLIDLGVDYVTTNILE